MVTMRDMKITFFKNFKDPVQFFRKPATLIAIGIFMLSSVIAYDKIRPAVADAESAVHGNIFAGVPKTTVITDRNGEILYYLYKDENRIMVPETAFPDHLKRAIIAAEDERFYVHKGFDPFSVIRAIAANSKEGHIVSGGSTLTMQLIKNVTKDARVNWQRKVKEAYLATVFERQYSKEQVLGMYLNMVPLGGNIIGAETASQLYYGKSAMELSLPEAATIAAIGSSPSYYVNNPDELKKRRNYVLNRMVATGNLQKEQAEVAAASDTPLNTPAIPYKAQHFVNEIINQLKSKYGEDIYEKGLTVRTSLDIPTQMQAEQTVKDQRGVLQNVGASNVGITVMDPRTGDVLAMIGSQDYFNDKNDGAVNMSTAPLSYGSTLKPLIYGFLMEKEHWSPGAIMWDVKTDFPIVGERKPYTPNDYDKKFFGPMTIREALATSRNVTAVKALQMVGLESTMNRLKEFGISSLGNINRYGPSFAIGGGEIPLVEMTGAYTAIANGGKVNPARYIIEVKDGTGEVVEKVESANKEVLKPEVAYELADILQDNNARRRVFGPNNLLVINGKTVGAKTGTAEDYRTALTIGFTPNVVVGVIVANNNNASLRLGAAGAMAAAPFFNNFMNRYLADKPNVWFERPNSIQTATFPTVVGRISDLVAPWQTPTDRFNKRVAEIDDPLWNRAVAGSKKSQTEPTATPAQTAQNVEQNNARDETADRTEQLLEELKERGSVRANANDIRKDERSEN